MPAPAEAGGAEPEALLGVTHGRGPTGRPFPDLVVPQPPAVAGPARTSPRSATRRVASGRRPRPSTSARHSPTSVGGCCSWTSTRRAPSGWVWASIPTSWSGPSTTCSPSVGWTPPTLIRRTRVPGLDLLPANIDLSAAELQLVGEVAREFTLQRALRPLAGSYDVVLVDCQPSLGLLTVNALTAAHGVLIPLECEFFALRGVALLTDTITKVRERLNPDLVVDGVLGTMYDGRTVHGREVLARVVAAFGDAVFHTVISRTVRFPETTVAGEPITRYAPTSAGAYMYRQVAREFAARALQPAPTAPGVRR